MYGSKIYSWLQAFQQCIYTSESTAMHQKSADLESMEFQESSFQEALGGWTEVELNAPKSSQAKVHMYRCSQFSMFSLSADLCTKFIMCIHTYVRMWCVFDSAICTFPNKEEELYQEAEPVVSTGLSAALQMAMKKGFVDTEKKKKDPNKIVHIYGDEQRDRYVHVRTCTYLSIPYGTNVSPRVHNKCTLGFTHLYFREFCKNWDC